MTEEIIYDEKWLFDHRSGTWQYKLPSSLDISIPNA